ncbi:MAG: universal stress protein [Nitrososphaeraceae archaeon]
MKSNMSDHEMVFHKIMVAIDGSEQSFKAVEYALDIAINQQKKRYTIPSGIGSRTCQT